MAQPFPHLFAPIQLGVRLARNRIMRLATTSNLGEHHQVSERLVAHLASVARGGAGIVVTEVLRVHPSNQGRGSAITAFRPEVVPGLRWLADAVHAEGALLIGQLNHGGRQHHAHQVPTLWAPSAIACPHSGGVPHAMTGSEVRDVIAGFVTSAVHARSAGLDGVEVHGAQGHLIQQFVSPFSNQRTDEYGGSLENRLRFTRDTLRGIRDACGPDFIVGYRMGIEEFTVGGITVEESENAAAILSADGLLDYLSLTQGNFNTIEMHAPDRRFPPVPFLDLHVRVRQAARPLAVVTCTRVQTPEQAEEILSNGAADLVGLCRALIVDPEWPLKARQGRPRDIRLCIGCNQCWGWITEGNPIACVSNPVVGNELILGELPRAAEPRRVVVVGGGPAGLEAARVAALRGHHVTLLEQEELLGGKVREGADVPGQAEFGNILGFLIPQVEALGVCLRTGVKATLATVLNEEPDAVIVATGATPVEPTLPGDGSVPALSTSGIRQVASLPGERVVLTDEDGYYWASAALETLLAQGKRVSYVTRFFEPLRELPALSRITALRAFDARGVDFSPNTFVDRVENGEVVLKHSYSSREERIADVAAVICVGPQRTNDAIRDELTAAKVPGVHLVGDAFAPRRLADAIREGHLAGRAV